MSTMQELKGELDDLKEQYPQLKHHELFVMWFVLARFGDDPEAAAGSLVGASSDMGIDAIWIDDDASTVCVVQGKYHTGAAKADKRADIVAFGSVAAKVRDP